MTSVALASQEALFHVPDLARALSDAHRVLRPCGRIAFADWIVHEPLSAADEQLLWDGIAAATLFIVDRHVELLRGAGFEIESIEYETDRWGIILAERLRMYQKRGEAEQSGAPAGHDDFYKSYDLSSVWCNRRSWVARDLLRLNPPDARPAKLNVARAPDATLRSAGEGATGDMPPWAFCDLWRGLLLRRYWRTRDIRGARPKHSDFMRRPNQRRPHRRRLQLPASSRMA